MDERPSNASDLGRCRLGALGNAPVPRIKPGLDLRLTETVLRGDRDDHGPGEQCSEQGFWV
jgi:hypothetical protein